jgi:hypothetical protein
MAKKGGAPKGSKGSSGMDSGFKSDKSAKGYKTPPVIKKG